MLFYSHFTDKETKEQELLMVGEGHTQHAGRQDVMLASALSKRAQGGSKSLFDFMPLLP